MASAQPQYGNIHTDTLKKMADDYIIKRMSQRAIAQNYQIGQSTIKRIALKYQWKTRRKDWDNKTLKKATTERANSANLMIGRMMDIFERHSINLLLLSKGLAPNQIIADSVVDQAYKLMGYMDKIAGQIQKSRENTIPDTMEVLAPDLNQDRIMERVKEGMDAGRKQLLEWEARRNPSLKEKEPEDVFDAQATPVKESNEDITFEGLNEEGDQEDDDDSPIGGIL